MGAVHAAAADVGLHAALLAVEPRRPPSAAFQRRRVERARPAGRTVGGRCAVARPVLRGSDPRGDRPEHHGVSYLDRLNFSALTCPDLLDDLRGIVERLQPALDELVKAAAETTS